MVFTAIIAPRFLKIEKSVKRSNSELSTGRFLFLEAFQMHQRENNADMKFSTAGSLGYSVVESIRGVLVSLWWQNNAHILNFCLRREFLIGKNYKFGQGGFEESLECQAKLGANNGNGD